MTALVSAVHLILQIFSIALASWCWAANWDFGPVRKGKDAVHRCPLRNCVAVRVNTTTQKTCRGIEF
ncbi:hypothetical protein PR003_g8697 [Phytophthora rubi]|uniref:Secreted protein n=1 Tax=Phytophthora rubi TaxID=129364 RepID=A0A6A3H1I0_9STRA|nr:hypothetical protein PR002_g29398 [Phytophthora rubi]KAE9343964.1 hypothetical protein PR003_g8697 [Phytophthora rubi]